MKKISAIICALFLFVGVARADEGMWTLPELKALNIEDMQARGLKLSAEDIYSINQSSLKDAILIFDNGCTGELISDQGLLLTNHHCGYDAIQSHSTVENDYLKDGFWAMSLEEEIPTPGLDVRFIKEIRDITEDVLYKLKSDLSEEDRSEHINKQIEKILKKENKRVGKKYVSGSAIVKPFYGGNQYVLFVIQQFNDVRMVGTPPSSIGKFGGDTDNWMWPRHTGDFSMFRVYADKDGNPAEYSKDNVPFKPAKSLKISLKGIQDNDFNMIMGFPGSTERYITSWELEHVIDILNTNRILIRGLRQELLMEDMMDDAKVRIQYASKYASSSNYWKNSIGQNEAFARLNTMADKQAIEAEFAAWVAADSARIAEYGEVLPMLESSIEKTNMYRHVKQYIYETITRSSEMLRFTRKTKEYLEDENLSASDFYKDVNFESDKKVTTAMFRLFYDNIDKQYQPELFLSLVKEYGSPEALAEEIFKTEIYGSEKDFVTYINSGDKKTYKEDLAYRVAMAFEAKEQELSKLEEPIMFENTKGSRLFMKGLIEMNKGRKVLAPDANFSIRLTYGNVKPYAPRDGVVYNFYTTLDGVIEKEDTSNPEEFTVPQKIKDLHAAKDYGRYANAKGQLPVAYITDMDITGGNSGSPVLNDKGELVGLAFDGNWEGMSGDILFDHDLQRCINVDIRYVLFIIDKFAGCTRLIEEMNIVE